MSQQDLVFGTIEGDGNGENLFVTFGKTHSNFGELYAFDASLGTVGGAALIGIAAGTFTATDVQGALLELEAAGGGDALVASPLSQFAVTTSLQLKGVVSGGTGSGALVFGTAPTITSPTGLVKGDVGLASVDDKSELDKPVSTLQQVAILEAEDEHTVAGVLTYPSHAPQAINYDVNGRLDYYSSSYLGKTWRLRMSAYDANSNLTEMVASDDDGTEAAGHFWTKSFTYDVNNQITEGAWA